MNSESMRKDKAKKIIHEFAVASATTSAAFSQGAIASADTPILTKLYLEMADRLATLFDQTLDEDAKTHILKNIVTFSSGRLAGKMLLGWIPGLGNAANAAITYQHTEKAGEKIYEYFEKRT